MKMIEKQIARAQKDIEKAQKAIERNTRLMEKNRTKAEKLGCLWTFEEWCDVRDSKQYTWEQYEAWDAWTSYRDAVEEAERALARAQKEMAKLTGTAEANAQKEAEDARIAEIEAQWFSIDLDKLLEEWEAYKARVIAEAKKDGIDIQRFTGNEVEGLTASGKRFWMYSNNGFTERSAHCYTLRIEGETIFTSGDFGTAYRYLKH